MNQKAIRGLKTIITGGLVGCASGWMLCLSFPPKEYSFLFFLPVFIMLSFFSWSNNLFAKVIAYSSSIIIFNCFLINHYQWVLQVAFKSAPHGLLFYKALVVLELSFGSVMVVALGVLGLEYLSHKNKALKNNQYVLGFSMAVILTLGAFFSTSNYDLNYIIPIIHSPLVKGMYVNYYVYQVIMLWLIFIVVSNLKQKRFFKTAIIVLMLFLFVVVNNLNSKDRSTFAGEVYLIPHPSFNLENMKEEEIYNEVTKVASLRTKKNKDELYIWTEALLTYNAGNEVKMKYFRQLLKNQFGGTHLFGHYEVKNSESGESSNSFSSYNTKTDLLKSVKKAYPAPIEEDNSYYRFIKKSDIKYSFNVRRTGLYKTLDYQNKKISLLLCNEITNINSALSEVPKDAAIILNPSNPPVEGVEFYEKLLDYYGIVFSKITNLKVVKVSTGGSVTINRSGKASKEKVTLKAIQL